MNWLLFTTLVLIAAGMIAPAIWRKDHRLQFPCLVGFAFLLNVALPLASLMKQPDVVPAIAVARFETMAVLCLAAAWAGYAWPRAAKGPKIIEFDRTRLIVSATVLIAFGFIFSLKYGMIEPEYDPEKSGMTGIGTILLTLAATMRYGFILVAVLVARTREWILLPLLVPQLIGYYRMLLIGRRSGTGEIAVIICMLLFFYRRWVLPLPLLMLGMVLAAMFSYNISEYRNTVDMSAGERIRAYRDENPLKFLTLSGMAEKNGYVEIYNGVNFIQATANSGHYTYGLHFWNQIVFGYVPAQWLGREFKESLKILLVDAAAEGGFEKSVGTCESGIGEACMAVGYVGCILFFGLGAYMRWLWEGAIRNSILHQFLLMLSTIGAILSFSAVLWAFLNQLIHIAIFAGPLLWWSSVKGAESAKVRNDQPSAPFGRRSPRRWGRQPGPAAPPKTQASNAPSLPIYPHRGVKRKNS